MSVSFNHTIVDAMDREASAAFLRRLLGLLEDDGIVPWADPFRRKAGTINTDDGGRGSTSTTRPDTCSS